jgi:uncharacterized spore protein YtfJ
MAMEMTEKKLLDPIQKMIDQLGVSSVFGEPFKEGDVTIIPVASMMVGFGYGYGEGPAGAGDDDAPDAPEAEADDASSAVTGGGGGGGGGKATPQGYLRVGPDGVTYEPIMDQGKIAMAGILMSGWSVFWIAKAVRALVGK